MFSKYIFLRYLAANNTFTIQLGKPQRECNMMYYSITVMLLYIYQRERERSVMSFTIQQLIIT